MEECVKNPTTKRFLVKKLVQLLRKEMKKMCSDDVCSVLQNKSSEALCKFSWESLIKELSNNAPILLHILQGCTKTRKPRINREATIGICAAILLRFRYARMSLVQKILSLVLYAGHSAKQVQLLISL